MRSRKFPHTPSSYKCSHSYRPYGWLSCPSDLQLPKHDAPAPWRAAFHACSPARRSGFFPHAHFLSRQHAFRPENASARRAAAAQLLLHIPEVREARTSRTARFRTRRKRRRSSQVTAIAFGVSRRVLAKVGQPARAGRMAISEGRNALNRPPTQGGPLPSENFP